MRTREEIAAYYAARQDRDVFGFEAQVLLPYLTADQVRPFMKDGADLSSWTVLEVDEAKAVSDLESYAAFAREKARDQRGLSAVRSVIKLGAWLWLLGWDEAMDRFKKSPYGDYGMPGIEVVERALADHRAAARKTPEQQEVERLRAALAESDAEVLRLAEKLAAEPPVRFKILHARIIAAAFLDYLSGDPDPLEGVKTDLCRWNRKTAAWEPLIGRTDALIADFIEHCRQE